MVEVVAIIFNGNRDIKDFDAVAVRPAEQCQQTENDWCGSHDFLVLLAGPGIETGRDPID